MRILNVRFRNLNSLWGEWKIDFTNPAYASDGIFVITGQTGAGKTTIFDAVCLALYGRTPRLKDITQGTNEIMSRQAGECFAEVTFETNMGKYCAFWGQHRAHKRPDGALQPPRHELADAATGEILETRQRDVDDRIKEATGLSFDQFVRSILLAQGDFAAFLQCEPGERSPILEQITGTEIYSQLSMRTHEIRNSERVALNLIEAEAAGVKGLDVDEREALEIQLNSLIREEAEEGKNLERYGVEYDWLLNIASLQKELDALEDRRKDLARRQEGFESERARFLRAQMALEFGSAHASLIAYRREQESEKQALFECNAGLPEFETDVRRSEEVLQLAISECSDKQTDRKNLQALLQKVRELDLKHREIEEPIKTTQATAEELANVLAARRKQLEMEHGKFEATQVRMRDIRKFLQDNAVDERLVEQIAGIRARFDTFCSLLDKRRRMSEECAAAEKLKEEAQKRLSGQNILYETAKAKFASLENAIKKQDGAVSEILGTRSIGEWREILTSLMERRVKLEQIEDAFRHRADMSASRQELISRKDALELSQAKCQGKITECRERIHTLENELQRLDAQAELIRRIKDLDEARERLMDGQPCPLCGSESHPYAVGNIPRDDEVQLLMRRVSDNLKNEQNTLSELNTESARLAGEAIQAEAGEARFQSQIQNIERSLIDDLTALQLSQSMDADPLAAISRERQRSEEHLQKTRFLVEQAEKGEEILRSMRNDLERSRQEREQLASSRQEADFEKEAALRELGRLTQDVRLTDNELKNMQLDLTRQVIPFGFRYLPEERPEQILETLEVRLARWQEQHKLRVELEKQLTVWERDLHHERTAVDNINLEFKDKSETAKKLRSEKDALWQQRVGLFGKKEPDEEEARQNALVEAAEKQVEDKRESRRLALQELSNMRSRIDALVKSIHIRADNLQKAELSFKKRLIANDFSNEDAYLSACLPEAERKILQERASSLDMEQAELEALHMDRNFSLEELRRQHVTDLTLEEAGERKIQTAALLKELQQSIGAISVRLEEEKNLALKRAELGERVERQRVEFRRWEKLHDLIGSADGQKYRNFVQELTLDMVIRNANRQLQKMLDRYFLVKDEDRPLSLSVIDNYQAGKQRSAKNLSGGESFIVSLALALGLSQMASQKIRVDSLFLDEGFGTLDEEALDMALSALTGLRREGKLIGIISHVEALKERIATQIEVIPQGNGRSLIKAPGCTGYDL